MDNSLSKVTAEEWLLRNIESTYKDIKPEEKEAIRLAVTRFSSKPGFTVGKVIKILRKHFGEERATLIATTEITRFYAYIEQIKGEQLVKDWPNVRVTKRWFTNNDDLVCEICKSLDGKEVDIMSSFAKGIFLPPAHPSCRCWISSGTNI
jgi:SPP1 gp7 family putative phage head morphogenesis protein